LLYPDEISVIIGADEEKLPAPTPETPTPLRVNIGTEDVNE
jgi:hypothetical protein